MNSTARVVFVCTGNICRSPMAEIIARQQADNAGLSQSVEFSSCGLGDWHVGQPADHRALAELKSAGYDGSSHRAAQLGSQHADADLFVAMDAGHARGLVSSGIAEEKISLLRAFDANSAPADEVADPYYGDISEFVLTRENIEAAMPGLLEWIRSYN